MKKHDIDINKFQQLLKQCLIDGLEIIKLHIEEEKEKGWNSLLDYHKEFPSISYLENGLPSFYLNDFTKRNFSKILSKENEFQEIKSWIDYHEFFRSSSFLKKYYKTFEFTKLREGTQEDIIEIHNRVYTFYFLLSFVDSYIHCNSLEFNETVFNNYFTLHLNSLIQEKHEFDVLIPILFTTFDFEEFIVAENISIIRLDEKQQLSRNIKKSRTVSVHDQVVGAATHAFRLRYWSIDNKDYDTIGFTLYDPNAFHNVMEVVDKLFATLRLSTNADTGYAQILTTPINSMRNFNIDLLNMSVITDRKYPEKFENYGWYNNVRTISQSELNKFNLFFSKVSPKYYSFAIKKLNSASLRKSEEDTILDITSALESLLTNDSKTEITYRLSIRIAQLCKVYKFKELNSKQVFELCKKLYNYRSAVVHGDTKKIEKTKTISVQNSEEIPIIGVAFELLLHLLKVLLENDILSVNRIDEIMFSD